MSVEDQLRILVVDDMLSMRTIIKKMLKKTGFTKIDFAEHGQMAWEMYAKNAATDNAYQLIISDWNMPAMSGIELLEKVRKKDKKIPFLMLTAETEPKRIIKAVKSGITAYINKPFKADQLAEKIIKISSKIQKCG